MSTNPRPARKAPQIAATGSGRGPAPFLKWAGGKTQLLSALDMYVPDKFRRYYEPFVGGGAFFFHLAGNTAGLKASLADANDELINCYKVIAEDVDALIRALKRHKNDSDYFYDLRAVNPQTLKPVDRAARLIFLNKTCFNGLYRVNSRGQFNVPFGSYKNPKTCDAENLQAVSRALAHVRLRCAAFEETIADAGAGDFVYLDPPYQPLSASSSFTSYTSRCFGPSDQESLAKSVRALHKRGGKFLLSNSDNELIHGLYKGFKIEVVLASRAINCRGDRRGKITELLVHNLD